MLTSTQVQQMTVAMFGAAAGGYTEELSAFESQVALGDFLATLDLATEKFADATTDLAKAKIIAGDFGLADNDEAVQQVIDWLEAGESLGTIYSAAIAYLTGDSVAADFADAAAGFADKVEGAVTFSADNADVTDVDALKAGVAATVADLALTAALDAIAAAEAAETAQAKVKAAFLEAAYTNAAVKADTTEQNSPADGVNAKDVIEADIAAAHLATAGILTGEVANTDGLRVDGSSSTTGTGSITDTASVFNGLVDDAQDARIATARADLAADIAAKDKIINDATTGTIKALKAGVAALVATADDAAAATLAALKADNKATALTTTKEGIAAGQFDIEDVSGSLTETASVSYVPGATPLSTGKLTVSVSDGGTGAAEKTGTLDIATMVSGSLTLGSAVTLTNGVYSFTVAMDIASPANPSTTADTMTIEVAAEYLDELVSAAQAEYASGAALEAAQDALAVAVSDVVTTQDTALSASTYATLAGGNAGLDIVTTAGSESVAIDYSDIASFATEGAKVDTYAEDVAELEAAEELAAAFEVAYTDWLATEALVDGLKAINDEASDLSEATTEAKAAVTDAVADGGLGKDLGVIGTDDADAVGGAVVDDVFVYVAGTGDTGLQNFGAEGTDSIYFGEGNFVLVALGADETLASDAVGDVAVAEIFWEDTAGGLKLYVEDETFAGSSTNGTTDITTIVLVGVEGADVSFANGYLSVSA